MEIGKLNLDGNNGTANITNNNYYSQDVEELQFQLQQKDFLITHLTETLQNRKVECNILQDIYSVLIMEKAEYIDMNLTQQLNLFGN